MTPRELDAAGRAAQGLRQLVVAGLVLVVVVIVPLFVALVLAAWASP